MLDWVNYQKELMGRIGELGALTPDTLKGYQALSAAGAKTAHLDAKTRELIALAVAVTTRCDGCITVHSAQALKHGATREEIGEALGVAVALNAGAAMVDVYKRQLQQGLPAPLRRAAERAGQRPLNVAAASCRRRLRLPRTLSVIRAV